MCLIIVKPPKTNITKNTLKDAFILYPDGFGFMTAIGERLFIYKAINNFRQLYRQFRQIEKEHPQNAFVFHFRQATAGLLNEANAHPFFVNENLGFCHNGIISITQPDLTQSDTVSFVENVLKKLPPDFLKHPGCLWLLEVFCQETFNKLVFMTNSGETIIFGEKQGYWKNGLWFSSKESYGIYTFKNFGFSGEDFRNTSGARTEKFITPAYEICIECGEYTEANNGIYDAKGFTCSDCWYYAHLSQTEGV
jgi:hypothetical protein